MQTAKQLAHTFVKAGGAKPDGWIVFLHGVFGMGQNFRTLAKRVVAERPRWGAILCDLRGHGGSLDFPAPHTLTSAAADVAALVRKLDEPVRAIAGHSLGGKVALAYLDAHPGELDNAFILDSVPSAREADATIDSAATVLAFLESVPVLLPSREAFAALARAAGMSAAITEWLAMNVRASSAAPQGELDGAGSGRASAGPSARRGDGRYGVRLDLPAIRSLLDDYFAKDLWGAVSDRSVGVRLDLVIADRSSQYSEADRAEARAVALSNHRVHVTIVPNAGHWLHVDAPDAVLEAIVRGLDDA